MLTIGVVWPLAMLLSFDIMLDGQVLVLKRVVLCYAWKVDKVIVD